MAKLGFVVDAFQIESIDDGQAGYIKALSQPHIAAVNQDAKSPRRRPTRPSSKVRQESDRNQAHYQQQTAVAKAEYQAQIDQAQQTAGQAGPLAQAKALQDVLSEQAKVAQSQAELRRQQLVAEVVRPAEAEAEKVRTLAHAQADAIRLQAEATATEAAWCSSACWSRKCRRSWPPPPASCARRTYGPQRRRRARRAGGRAGVAGELDTRRRSQRQRETGHVVGSPGATASGPGTTDAPAPAAAQAQAVAGQFQQPTIAAAPPARGPAQK